MEKRVKREPEEASTVSDPAPSTAFDPGQGRGTSFAGWLVDHPWWAMLLALLLAVPCTLGMKHITSDFSHRGFFMPDDPMLVAVEELERRFGNDDSVVLVVHSPSGIFDRETVALLHELTAGMWLVPEVIRVQSLTNYQWVHAVEDEIEVEPLLPEDLPITEELLAERRRVALGHEVLPGFLVSDDARTATVFGYVKPSLDETPDMPTIVAAVEEMVARAEAKGGDHVFHLTGRAAVNASFKRSMQADMKLLVPLVFLLTIVFLGVGFRRLSGVGLPLLVIVASILVAFGLLGWLGLKITNTTSIIPQILIAIGVADSVHVLHSFYAALRGGETRRDAAVYALSKNLRPTLLTSVSTAIGFFSYVTSDILAVFSLGAVAGLGVLVAWLFTYFLLGPLTAVLPLKPGKRAAAVTSGTEVSPRATAYVAWLVRWHLPLIAVFGLLVIGSTLLSLKNTVNSDPFAYFAEGLPIRVANDFTEEHLGGVNGVEVVIDSGEPEGVKDPDFLRRVEAYQTWIDQLPGVTKTISLVDVLKQTNRALHGGGDELYVLPETRGEIAQQIFLYTMSLPQGMDVNDRITVKNDALRLSVLWTIRASEEAEQTAAEIKAKAEEMGLVTVNTGKMMLYQSMNGYVVRSFLSSISLAMVLIGALLLFALRSVPLALLGMVANVAPLLIGGAVIWLMSQPLDVGTVIVASVCLGVAVDDTIHFLADFERRRSRGLSARQAVCEVFTHTAPALIVTTLILVASFAVFAFATFTPNRNFGVFTSVILGAAGVLDLTLLPALLLGVYGRKEPAGPAA